MEYFWTNTIWYILLSIITIILLIISLRHAERPKRTLAFYISVVGLTLLFETTIKIVFKAYTYYPLIILSSPYNDSLAGNLFSQYFVSSTAIIIAVFNRNVYWKLSIALFIIGIEELYTTLGVYEQHWYKTWMTFVGLMILYWIVHPLYKRNPKLIPNWLYYTYLFLGMFTMHIASLLWTLTLTGLQHYNTELFLDAITSYYGTGIIYGCILAIAMISVHLLMNRILWKILVFLAMYGLNFVAAHYQIIIFKENWMLFSSTLTIFWMYAAIRILDYLYKAES